MSNFKKSILISMVFLLNFIMPGNFIHAITDGGGVGGAPMNAGDQPYIIHKTDGTIINATRDASSGNIYDNTTGRRLDAYGDVMPATSSSGSGTAGTNASDGTTGGPATGVTSASQSGIKLDPSVMNSNPAVTSTPAAKGTINGTSSAPAVAPSAPTSAPSATTVAPSTTQSTGSRADRKAARQASKVERKQANQKGSGQMGKSGQGKRHNAAKNPQMQKKGGHKGSDSQNSRHMRTRQY